MYEVSIKHQVLCITHLPQIAALSDSHYFVSKEVLNGKTFTGIRMLNKDEKIKEIATHDWILQKTTVKTHFKRAMAILRNNLKLVLFGV